MGVYWLRKQDDDEVMMTGSQNKVKNKRSRRAIIVMVLVVSAAMMMSIFSRIENWKRDFTVNHAKLDPALERSAAATARCFAVAGGGCQVD